jgi:hypothetical protein
MVYYYSSIIHVSMFIYYISKISQSNQPCMPKHLPTYC